MADTCQLPDPPSSAPFDASEAPDLIAPIAISLLARDCLERFQKICDVLRNFTKEKASQNGYDRNFVLLTMQDARARFKAWGTSIAAFREGHVPTSLDFRLREAPDIRNRLLQVLEYLQEYLHDATQVVAGEKPNQTWTAGAIIDNESDSEDEVEEQIREGQSDANLTEAQETSDLQELCAAITSSNGSLMKLSMLIRESSNRDDYLKAASRYSTWNPSPYIGHVREKHGSAKMSSEWLVDRLGRAIMRRRQFLTYREEHHGKLTGDWGEILNEVEEKEQETVRPAKTVASTKATTFIVDRNACKKEGSDCGGSFGSQTSYEPTTAGGEDAPTKLTVPPPPKWAFEDVPFEFGEPFQCPYCYTEQEVKNKAAWKRHVFRDLKPYVCTFRGCAMRMFRSRNEWFAHELQCHRREWVCQYCQHSAFATASAYSNHLKSAHSAILVGSQLEAVLLQSEEPVDKISATACPLCDDWETNLQHSSQDAKRLLLNDGKVVEPYGTPKQFRRHLGRHLEQLALFALPIKEGDCLEGDSQDEAEDDDTDHSENPQVQEDLEDEESTVSKGVTWGENETKNYEVENYLELGDESVSNSEMIHDRTPLSWAAAGGHEAVVKLPLEKGANVNAAAEDDRTPLWSAAAEEKEKWEKMLMEEREAAVAERKRKEAEKLEELEAAIKRLENAQKAAEAERKKAEEKAAEEKEEWEKKLKEEAEAAIKGYENAQKAAEALRKKAEEKAAEDKAKAQAQPIYPPGKLANRRITGAQVTPPGDSMTEVVDLEDVDPSQQARATGGAMDEDDEDGHPGAERVQCASQ